MHRTERKIKKEYKSKAGTGSLLFYAVKGRIKNEHQIK